MVFPTIQQRFPNEKNHNCRLSDHLTYYVAHNTLGVSYVAYSIIAGWLICLRTYYHWTSQLFLNC